MTVNITALSASISSAVKQAVVEALPERTQPSSGQSPPAPIAEQSVADAVGASLASITQGILQSSVNDLTVGTLSTDDGDGNGDVGTERKDWGENAVVARILNIKHLPNLQR